MKFNPLLPLIFFLSVVSCKQTPPNICSDMKNEKSQTFDTSDMTNNFYDNVEAQSLPVKELIIDGEIENPGKVDFSGLPVHSVIVKETLLDSAGGDRFVGAYRYDGYSLFDVLNSTVIKKANGSEFRPVIDLYVEVENANGEKVVFSWGEIYYPINLHKIIIANAVARIVPSKTKDLWPLPSESKVVAGGDLVTERNISSPVKITVKSYPHSFKMQQGMSPLYSNAAELFNYSENPVKLETISPESTVLTFNTVFYGRGKGIHSTTPFKGYQLKDIIQKYYPFTKKNLQTGMLCIAGKDGYRSAVSYSELFNRNDQQEFMIIMTKSQEDGGLFRIFASADFFSDRAVKSVSEIHLLN
jgi:hypothetical protein